MNEKTAGGWGGCRTARCGEFLQSSSGRADKSKVTCFSYFVEKKPFILADCEVLREKSFGCLYPNDSLRKTKVFINLWFKNRNLVSCQSKPLRQSSSQKSRLHSLSTGTPFIAQVTDGLGMPLALQVSTPFSPGARTRLRGGALIQYGAAENRRSGRRLEN